MMLFSSSAHCFLYLTTLQLCFIGYPIDGVRNPHPHPHLTRVLNSRRQWFEIWWLDAVGAIFISLYIIYEWIHT